MADGGHRRPPFRRAPGDNLPGQKLGPLLYGALGGRISWLEMHQDAYGMYVDPGVQ
jgi:hypothetical protein